jgi:NAD(P)-dependent dehydrogenase (short-subunit alcohol dehydrogenase family)
MKKLERKVAVITGGGRGIGAASARLFHEEGAKVAIFGRTESELSRLCAELGSNSMYVQGDVLKLADLEKLFRLTHDKFGPVDIVFANAGINNPPKTIDNMSEEDFNFVFDVNTKGVYFTVQKALPFLNKPASIILTSSVANVKGYPFTTIYAATKAAVRCFARGMSRELAERGVRVNVLTPGPTDLDGENDEAVQQVKQNRARLLETIPAKRVASTAEIAQGALFLASDSSSFMFGSELVMDGGLTQV